ncbi:hypothetical protein [Lichenifustis flavocetrariae]|uniref:Uncharacterized protein n=1 Tax=Lichenifustis flavocetrariae TaxID=2949735 RepID=A0AA41YS61_9HYPH|nr:hypothetical protein [Lichenifustis flavocetrariae]MCW6507194.1 hypothetical protein [Lichenifustis flavocetrariae]
MPKLSPEEPIPPEASDRLLRRLLKKSTVSKADVAALRASELGLGVRSVAEAEMLFAIERKRSEKCREWGDLLVEFVADFAIWGERPTGTLSESRALWLSDQVGELPSPACLALLIAVIDDAQDLPAWFVPAVRVRASKVFGAGRERTALQQAA